MTNTQTHPDTVDSLDYLDIKINKTPVKTPKYLYATNKGDRKKLILQIEDSFHDFLLKKRNMPQEIVVKDKRDEGVLLWALDAITKKDPIPCLNFTGEKGYQEWHFTPKNLLIIGADTLVKGWVS